MENFVAIDFETATGDRNSACAVAIVTVEEGIIVEEYSQLIQPPSNDYTWRNIQVHGIRPNDTVNSPSFSEVYPELHKRLTGKTVVAHNEAFDRSVMQKSMESYDIPYADLGCEEEWVCTVKKYRANGFKSAALNVLCDHFEIKLQHHDALSDARACAKLYLKLL